MPVHVTIGGIWIDVSVRENHDHAAEVTEHPVEAGSVIADHVRPLPKTLSIEGIVTNHPIEVPQSHMGTAREVFSAIEIEVPASPLPRVAPNSIQIQGEPTLGMYGALPGVAQGAALLGAINIDVRSRVELSAEQVNLNTQAKTRFSAIARHFSEAFDRVGAVHAALVEIVDQSKLITVVTGLVTYENVALTNLSIERSGEIGRSVLKFSVTGRVLRIVQSERVRLPDPVDARAKPGKSLGKQATTPVEPTPPVQEAVEDSALLRNIYKEIAARLAG